MRHAHHYSAWFLYGLIGSVFLVLGLAYPHLYVRLTYEDLYGEWLQTWLFAAVCGLSAALARRPWRYRWFFALLALAAFYVVMEEISWGQRLAGWESPAFFAAHNIQGETNLHNFLTGPHSTLLKDVIEYGLAIALVGYGLLYPLALRTGWAPARLLDRLGVAAPPLYLFVFFINAAAFEVGWLSFNEAEIAEIFVGTAVVLMLLHYLLASDTTAPALHVPAPTGAKRFAVAGLGSFILLAGLAGATTTWFQTLPGRADAIDRRLANGYEKYAPRYEDRRPDLAADLQRRVFEQDPDNLEALQKALDYYEQAGDQDSYRHYQHVMLDATAKQLGGMDASIENLLMLAENYANLGDRDTETRYLEQAVTSAEAAIASAPEESAGYYWLGRTRQQRGEFDLALRAFDQALAIEPRRARYTLARRRLVQQATQAMPATQPD
jgi:hypothetical protein